MVRFKGSFGKTEEECKGAKLLPPRHNSATSQVFKTENILFTVLLNLQSSFLIYF